MKELSTEEKAKRYVEALDKAKKVHKYSSDLAEIKRMENIFPELIESEDEKIRKSLLEYLHTLPNHYAHSGVCVPEWLAWLEKQGNSSKECLNLPHFTFDDVLALQCCMATVKKVQEDKELYEQLQNLHNRLHDAYWLEKQGEPVEINPTEFDTRLQALIGKFDSLPKEELIGSLSFWLNVVQNDGTYNPTEKQGEQKASYTTIVETGDGGINALVTRELPTDSEQKLVEWHIKKRWRPTETQMASLLVAVGDEKKLGSDAYKDLYNLYLQLKQL